MTAQRLLEPLELRGRTAPSRIVFAAHPTNFATERTYTARHVAYYGARAAGGVGIVVVEGAHVHPTSRPYEYAPAGDDPAIVPGLHAVGEAIRSRGALALLALEHAGGQGSSHWNQRELWAPSAVPEVNSREVPKAMEARDVAEVVAGFAATARHAVDAGLDGVELAAGQGALLRQFLSPLTNHRGDAFGGSLEGRLRLTREVIEATRAALGDLVLGLRLSGDEHAPWAGLKPADAAEIATLLVDAGGLDYVAVTSGGPYSVHSTRAGLYAPPGSGAALARGVRERLREAGTVDVAVFAQGSVVDAAMAEALVAEGGADAVEMTRALIADPDLPAKLRDGRPGDVRPCLLCNQDCVVATVQNPRLSCVHNPAAGHEVDGDLVAMPRAAAPRDVCVVGAGPAGLEAARVAASRGHRVTVLDRRGETGGTLRAAAAAAPGRERLALAVDWLEAQCRAAGVIFDLGEEATPAALAERAPDAIVLATGGQPGPHPHIDVSRADVPVLAARAVLEGDGSAPREAGHAVVLDQEGGHAGMGVAEWLHARGWSVTLVTPDMFAGQRLTATLELTPWNQRAHGKGIVFRPQLEPTAVEGRAVHAVDVFSGEPATLDGVDLVVSATYELPASGLYDALRRSPHAELHRAGDAVAPRRLSQAILEGARVGRAV